MSWGHIYQLDGIFLVLLRSISRHNHQPLVRFQHFWAQIQRMQKGTLLCLTSGTDKNKVPNCCCYRSLWSFRWMWISWRHITLHFCFCKNGNVFLLFWGEFRPFIFHEIISAVAMVNICIYIYIFIASPVSQYPLRFGSPSDSVSFSSLRQTCPPVLVREDVSDSCCGVDSLNGEC